MEESVSNTSIAPSTSALRSPIGTVIQTSSDLTLDSAAETSGFYTTKVHLNPETESPVNELSPLLSVKESVPASSSLSDIIKICEKHVFDQQNTVQGILNICSEITGFNECAKYCSQIISFCNRIVSETYQNSHSIIDICHGLSEVKLTPPKSHSNPESVPKVKKLGGDSQDSSLLSDIKTEEKCEESIEGVDSDDELNQEEDPDWTAHWAKKVKITLKRKGTKGSKSLNELEDEEASLDETQFSDWEPCYDSEPEVKKKSKKKKTKGKSSKKRKESKPKAKDDSEQGEFPCTLCKKICKTKDAHSKHEALHKCDVCGLIMLSPGTIYDHKRSYHSGEKPFVCDICGSSFSTNPILKKHKINIHTEGRPFPCDQCQYGAKSLELLRRHKLVHSGEKKFQCDDCGACFPRAATLKEHVLIHKDVWPHHCQFCPKRFKNIRQLRRHEEVHLDQYKYQCKVCGKRMRQVGNLNTHMRTHNGEKPYACDKCGKRFAHNVTRKQHMESCFGNMDMLASSQNLLPLPLPIGLQFPNSAIDCSGPSQHRF